MSEVVSNNISDELQATVLNAYELKTPLRIQGGNSKAFYGYDVDGSLLDVSGHQGIISYEPTELVISAHAGTLLKTLEAVLDEQNQILAFEPPAFGDTATIGGTIACNLSGPRRAYGGAARDLLLGSRILNGKGERLTFGGEVMKNVAGYDVSRLMAGAMGTLGVLLDVSLKTLPKPETELTLMLSIDTSDALAQIHQWSRLPMPISASCIVEGQLFIRLSGTDDGIQAARKIMGGETIEYSETFWQSIKEQQHNFFKLDEGQSLWRLSLASNAPELDIDGSQLYEWGGALRWLKTTETAQEIREIVESLQGHAIHFQGTERNEIFHPLNTSLLKLHQNLKQSFDPEGILNPGRMYPDF